ncbi:glycosyltransferase [Elusimicrobiota bacterium]
MRIAVIVREFPYISETFILNQITGLLDKIRAVDIYSRRKNIEEKIHQDVIEYDLLNKIRYLDRSDNHFRGILKGMIITIFRCIRFPSILLSPGGFLSYIWVLYSARKLYMHVPLRSAWKYDIIHCHFGPVGRVGLKMKELAIFRGKLITSFYGFDVSSYINRAPGIYRNLFDGSDLIIAISEYMKRQLCDLGCNKEKILIHHLGVDCKRFSYKIRSIRKDEAVRIVTVARLVEKKGVEYGMHAVARLIKSGIKVEYSIVGDGPLKSYLNMLIKKLDVNDKIRILGWKRQDEVIRILNNSHILLAPSITGSDNGQEGTPVVLMEAMATGMPVISTYHAGIPELVDNGQNGFLVPEKDIDALTGKIEYLINNKELWPVMGRYGRNTVEKKYNIDILNETMVQIYSRLANNSV